MVFLEDSVPGDVNSLPTTPAATINAPDTQFSAFNLGGRNFQAQPPPRPAEPVLDEEMLSADHVALATHDEPASDMHATGWCRIEEEPPED